MLGKLKRNADWPDPAGSSRSLSPREAWYAVILLAVLYVFSGIDRTILALLAAPVSGTLAISDVRMGFIFGSGFAILYSMAGLPLSQMIDTGNRRSIIMVGAMLWSAMTFASAFATGFWTLLICRSGVAIGEAVLTPAAVSLIGDMFPREKRSLPTSIYATAGPIAGSGAFIVGAIALHFSTPIAEVTGHHPWQLTLMLVAAPGLFFGLLYRLTVREPPRVRDWDKIENPDFAFFLQHLREGRKFYLPFIGGAGLLACFNYSQIAWSPTVLARDHNFPLEKAGYIFGAIGMIGGIVGAFLVPFLMARKVHRPRPHLAIPSIMIGLSLLTGPSMVLTPACPSPTILLLGVFINTVAASSWCILMPLGFQRYSPSRMRARLMASYILTAGLLGLAIGPIAVPLLGSWWGDDGRPLAHGLASLGGIVALFFFASCILVYRALSKFTLSSGPEELAC